jgi:hypothetical protein
VRGVGRAAISPIPRKIQRLTSVRPPDRRARAWRGWPFRRRDGHRSRIGECKPLWLALFGSIHKPDELGDMSDASSEAPADE